MKRGFFIITLVLVSLNSFATISKMITVITAGTLSNLLTATEKTTVTNFTVNGFIDARDVKCMRDEMSVLSVLDLSGVSIQAYNGNDGTTTSTIYPANEMPAESFYKSYAGGKSTLISISMPNSLISIGEAAFSLCPELTGILIIPNSVKSISNSAFYHCSKLKGVSFSSSLTSIGYYAFSQCYSLNGTLTLPNNLISIGFNAFEGCSSLTGTLTLSNSLTSIGSNAFYGCSGLTGTLNIPSLLTSIGDMAFYGCSGLTTFTVQSGNRRYIGSNGLIYSTNQDTIMMCPNGRIGNIEIPNTVKCVYHDAFNGCFFITGNLVIPNSVISVGDNAFFGCRGLTGSITLPISVTSVGYEAFYGCSGLTGSFIVPNSVTQLGFGILSYCSGLESLTIPSSITSIGNNAFNGCSGLNSIYSYSITPVTNFTTFIGSTKIDIFTGVDTTKCVLYVPIGSKSLYQSAIQWKKFTNIVELTTSVMSINDLKINLYPNPILDYFQINGFNGTALISIRDLNGKSLLKKQIVTNERINVSSLSKGIYVLELIANEGTKVNKIVKN